ncbi:hypothetical protein TNCV_682461 [Trichonephila clavipes]|nr:hypothetical protein TNCV_682461 [Trichonephila clavipes]
MTQDPLKKTCSPDGIYQNAEPTCLVTAEVSIALYWNISAHQKRYDARYHSYHFTDSYQPLPVVYFQSFLQFVDCVCRNTVPNETIQKIVMKSLTVWCALRAGGIIGPVLPQMAMKTTTLQSVQ